MKENKKHRKKKIIDNEIKFPSSDIMLSVIQKEYDYETTRKERLETRAGVFLTLTLAILTILISRIYIPEEFRYDNAKWMLAYIIYAIAIISAFISVFFSIFYLVSVLFILKYERIDLKSFTRELAQYKKDVVMMGIIERYIKIISNNQIKNNEKTKKYICGTRFVMGAIVTISIATSIRIFI